MDLNRCFLDVPSFKQGKRFYERIKYLENEGYILIIRDKGVRNIYRITQKGVNFVMGVIPQVEFDKIYENRI
jgi:predicted transcriptional regulator